jgi:hypothetical protein
LIDNDQEHPPLLDTPTLEDVGIYSSSQCDFMQTADKLLSSATSANCIIDHEILMGDMHLSIC